MKNYKVYKALNNGKMPSYDIGKLPTNPGYQQGGQDVMMGSVDNPGENMSAMAKAQKLSNISTGITDSMSTATNVGTNIIKGLGSTASNIGTQGLSFAGTKLAPTIASDLPTVLGLEGADAAMTGIYGGASALSKAVGYGTQALGAVVGGLLMGKGIYDMNHSLSLSDLQDWAGSQTNYGIGNRQYKTYTSPGNAAMSVVNQRLRSGGIGTTLGATSMGASLGSLGGSIAASVGSGASAGSSYPGIGTAIGAAVGLIAGLGTYFGKRHRLRKEAKEMISGQVKSFDAYNQQSLAEANTLGLRDEFNASHGETVGTASAAKGKQPFDPTWAMQNGWAHNGEYQFDSNTGIGHKITNGTAHNEDAPIHAEPEDVIATDRYVSKLTGNTIAKSAEAASKNIENGNNVEYNKRILAALTNEQAEYQALDKMNRKLKHNMIVAAKGWQGFKNRIADDSSQWLPWAVNTSNLLANTGINLSTYYKIKGQSARGYNPYADNSAALAALDQARPYIDYSALNDVDNQLRLSRYQINHGAYAPGQQLSANTALGIGAMNAKASARNQALSTFFTNYQQWAKERAGLLDSAAQRRTAANEYADDAYRKAQSSKYTEAAKTLAAQSGTNNSYFENLNNMLQFNRNMGLYQQKLDNDQEAKMAEIAALGAKNNTPKVENTKAAPVLFNPNRWSPMNRYFQTPVLTYPSMQNYEPDYVTAPEYKYYREPSYLSYYQ